MRNNLVKIATLLILLCTAVFGTVDDCFCSYYFIDSTKGKQSLKQKGDVYYDPTKNKPYSGKAISECNGECGEIYREGNMKDGKPYGNWRDLDFEEEIEKEMTKAAIAEQGTIVPGNTLADKLNWLNRSADSHNTYILEVNANENIAPYTFEYKGAINITVVLKGIGENRIIKLKSHGNMFTVKKDVTFVLDNNITLQGHNGNNGSMVYVEGGEFKMNSGTITGNSAGWGGGGVMVRGGTFTMNGGTISGNKCEWGGGVHLYPGNFTMNGGTISGNNASEAGGGVYLNEGGATFVMSGGTITGNTARRVGGAIQLWRATFTMQDGIITNNKAGDAGGGIWFNENSSFTKIGGTITGYKSNPNNGNVVNDGAGVIARKGHAIYVSENQRKETTAGTGVNLSCDKGQCTGTWDE